MARRDADDESRSGAKSVAELLREAGRVNGTTPRRRAEAEPPAGSSPFGGLPRDQRVHPISESERRDAEERARAAELQARREAEERAESARLARLEADFQARLEAEEAHRRELAEAAAADRARQRAEAAAAARRAAEEEARRQAEEQARLEAERAAAEEAARLEAERVAAEAERRAAEQRETERREKREAEERAVREAARRAEADRRAAVERERRARLAELAQQDQRAPSWFTLSEFAPGDPRNGARDRPTGVPTSGPATAPSPPSLPSDRTGSAAASPQPVTARPKAWPPDDSPETPSWLSEQLGAAVGTRADVTAPLPSVPAEIRAPDPATARLAQAALAQVAQQRSEARVEEAVTGPTPVLDPSPVLPPAPVVAPAPAAATRDPQPAATAERTETESGAAKRPTFVHYLLAIGELVLAVALGLGLSYLFRQLWDFTPYVAAVAAPVAVCGLVGIVGVVRKRLHLGAVPLGLLLVILFVATLLVVLPAAWVISPLT